MSPARRIVLITFNPFQFIQNYAHALFPLHLATNHSPFPFPWRCQHFNVRRLVTVVQLPAAGTPLIIGTCPAVSRHLAFFLKTLSKKSTICYCMSCDGQNSLSILVVDSKKLVNVHLSARVYSKYDSKQSTTYSAKCDHANKDAWQNYGSCGRALYCWW